MVGTKKYLVSRLLFFQNIRAVKIATLPVLSLVASAATRAAAAFGTPSLASNNNRVAHLAGLNHRLSPLKTVVSISEQVSDTQNTMEYAKAMTETLEQHKLPLRNDRDLDPLLESIGDKRFVFLGESSHGTHEFYTWRAHITKRLIEEKGFNFVGVEGDWPDCYVGFWQSRSSNSSGTFHFFDTSEMNETSSYCTGTQPLHKRIQGLSQASFW